VLALGTPRAGGTHVKSSSATLDARERRSKSRAGVHGSEPEDVHDATAPPTSLQRGIALGFLSMLPLFFAYEFVQAGTGVRGRNAAEVVLTLPFTTLGIGAGVVRVVALVLATIAAGWACFHVRLGLVTRVGRVVVEGAVFALILGPLLIVLQRALELGVPAGLAAPVGVPPIDTGLLQVSGAAFEEIVFRVGLQSALFVLATEVFAYFTDVAVVTRVSAEVAAVGLSALVFAAAHLAVFTHLLGGGGEAWDPAVFAWRFLAGAVLGVLFRVRGPGVAAWTHAFFNLALFVGAGPDVFL